MKCCPYCEREFESVLSYRKIRVEHVELKSEEEIKNIIKKCVDDASGNPRGFQPYMMWSDSDGMDYIKRQFEALKKLEGETITPYRLWQINPARTGIGYGEEDVGTKLSICLTHPISPEGFVERIGPVIGTIQYKPVFKQS